MDELTIAQIIDGFRMMPVPLDERAAALAAYLSREPHTMAAVERLDGSTAYIIQQAILEDFETWRLNGYVGDAYRTTRLRFRIDMDPTVPLDLVWEKV
jgi:hypothetical protein